MQVLVDTSVWSLALRRASGATGKSPATKSSEEVTSAVTVLRDLIADGRATMIGAVRQELLSGIQSASQFHTLREALAGFEDISLTSVDFELAAEFFNTCRSKGIQGSNTDFLICAVASGHKLPILTTDKDFVLYKKHLPIELLTT